MMARCARAPIAQFRAASPWRNADMSAAKEGAG